MNNKYPIFVPTKGRFKTPYTINAFEKCNIPYMAIVEKQEYKDYAKVIDKNKIIVLPHQNKGLTVTRNWIWDYAQNELKTPYFWTFDDNIRKFYQLNNNMKYSCTTGTFLKIIEEFAQRFKNLYITGMQYEMFVPRKRKISPLTFNTRIYSNMLIKTNIPYRNECFYNDDTDLCLRILKAGKCTVLFNSFLADKINTMQVKGGMTDFYEKTDNRKQFAIELRNAHPDVVQVVKKYGRWHHQVNYKPFNKNKLIRDESVTFKKGVNNYGMELKKVR